MFTTFLQQILSGRLLLVVIVRQKSNLSIMVSLVQLFVKVHNEKVYFQKTEYLVKAVKKCFLKKLSVWLTLIKVTI